MSENIDMNGAIVVFGLDGKRRPRAGVFAANDAEAAAERGRAHNLVVRPVSTDALVEAVQGLSPGDLTAEETKFIPSVARPVYDKLLAASGILRKDQDPPSTPYASRLSAPPVLPAGFSEIAVGSTVLAKDDLGSDGWYEALILEEQAADQFAVMFRGYPDEGVLTRRRDQLGLIPLNS